MCVRVRVWYMYVSYHNINVYLSNYIVSNENVASGIYYTFLELIECVIFVNINFE